jgi:hypothetical protein
MTERGHDLHAQAVAHGALEGVCAVSVDRDDAGGRRLGQGAAADPELAR